MKSEFTTKDIQKYAWDYFQLHAAQRMTAFNFFIILSALLTTGLVTSFQPVYKAHFIGMFLGLLLMLISFIFWKLDQRVKYFIKNAEDALKYIESTFTLPSSSAGPHLMQLFTYEEASTKLIKDKRVRWFWQYHLTYAQSFSLVFAMFASFGLIGFFAALLAAIRG